MNTAPQLMAKRVGKPDKSNMPPSPMSEVIAAGDVEEHHVGGSVIEETGQDSVSQKYIMFTGSFVLLCTANTTLDKPPFTPA